jgi:nitrite reductase/ring-hydroxylating ferredoxin subunit
MAAPDWHDLGTAEALSAQPIHSVTVGRLRPAVSVRDGEFGVIQGACSHAGAPYAAGPGLTG